MPPVLISTKPGPASKASFRRPGRHSNRERAGWNDTRAELEGTRTRLEDELRAVQETLGRERGNWDAARGDLEGTRSGLEADLARAHEALRAVQMESDAQRTQIEAALREARETLDTERSASEQAREQLESELRQARTAAHAAHHEWDARVAQLETELAEARERAASLEGLREALEAAHAELRHTDAAHAADRLAWQAATEALERQRADLDTRAAADRDAWTARLAALEADLRDADHIRQEHQRLSGAIDALRADYASMVQTLATERADRDRDRREIEALRATVDQHRQRGRELEADIERTAREADERAAQLDADHAARYRALEGELVQNAQRFARLSEEAERARTALRGEYVRAAESHNRLIGSDLFGYAVTTLPGELVRCNDAFARLFGYTDAPDAMTRTEGRVFPGLAGRADLLARLTAEGHLDRVDSCFERLDGTPVRAVESLSLLSDQTDAEVLVEHIVVGVATGATSEQLQARRLEEVGSLTTAMAPEIETLVATLHERSRDVRARLEESVVDSQDIEALTALASQVTMLVRQLAAFSRRQVREAEAADLNTAVARAEPILMRLVGDYIGFAVRFGETSPIAAHQDDLEQLFTSLVTLGRDLLPAGGSLMLETRRIPPGSATPDDDTDRALGGALLVVHASGYGVQFPGGAPALELVVQRCGGQLRLSGDPGWIVDIEVFFPRCGRPARSGWNWLVEGGQ